MEAWIHKKSLVIENLLGVTANLIKSLGDEDWTQFDLNLRRRAQLFSELHHIDTQHEHQVSGEEGKWLAQLQALEAMGAELQGVMMRMKTDSVSDMEKTREEKIQWIQENMLAPRGQQVEVKA